MPSTEATCCRLPPKPVADSLEPGVESEEGLDLPQLGPAGGPWTAHPLVVFLAAVDKADHPTHRHMQLRSAGQGGTEHHHVSGFPVSTTDALGAAIVEGRGNGGKEIDVSRCIALYKGSTGHFDGDRGVVGEGDVGFLQGRLDTGADSVEWACRVWSAAGGTMHHPSTRSSCSLAALAAGLLPLIGCDAETGFSKSADQPVTESGAGDIAVEPLEILIEDIDWEGGVAKGQVVRISNEGDNNLRVHNVALSNNGGGALYLEELDELNLAPGGYREFSIIATLTTFEPVESALLVQSGDFDESNLTIPILAVPSGYQFPEDTGDTGD